jgi:NAD(P)-dependent dehydrogenase (short-subunit alcohol dehydrogenase family)
MLLNGKICIIAGAARARGIGNATAQLFAEQGAKIVIADRFSNPETAARMIDDLVAGGVRKTHVIAVRCDITKPEDCAHLVETTLVQFGQIDVLVNSAGIVDSRGLLEINSDQFDQMIGVNLKGAFNLCQAILRAFVKQGHGVIVNIASLAAQRGGGLVGGAHYASSKGGVVSLTRSIAREFVPQGIRANIICPAMAQTAMIDDMTENQIDAIVADIPLRRLGTPREVAGACLFLASDLSGYVTGATIDVNGGLHIR